MTFWTPVFFVFPTVLSAFLLFLVQPILSKQILPWFGGSASVWNTCLFFFQLMLLAGYAYAYALTRFLSAKMQMVVHVTLIIAALATLPVIASPAWNRGTGDPTLTILLLLLATVGLPYFVLSSTSPLLQAWYARTFAAPYRLFALSNAASLAGLLAYPFLIEPVIAVRGQALSWSLGFVAFGIVCSGAAVVQLRTGAKKAPAVLAGEKDSGEPETPVMWVGLSALGSLALVSITSFIAQNIASMPLIWVVPLAIYLITFIIAFSGWKAPREALGVAALVFAIGMVASIGVWDIINDIRISLPLFLCGLFLLCLYCHAELAATKPAPHRLTYFYILVALGGAIGALCSSILAPLLLSGTFEMPMTLAAIAAIIVLRTPAQQAFRRAGLAGLALVVWLLAGWQIEHEISEARILARNFYSSLRIIDKGAGSDVIRRMEHGGIEHGAQYLDATKRKQPISYHGPGSGVALAIKTMREVRQAPLRIGVVGLGAGALAAYGERGGFVGFYEINPQVIELAHSQFTYLADCEAATAVEAGDARLVLERQEPQNFDVLAIDAFSGDAIPIHLLTREALDIYRRHLAKGGVLVFNITNNFVNLQAALARLAEEAGLGARLISDDNYDDDDPAFSNTEFVLMSADPGLFEQPGLARAEALEPAQKGPAWTDDFNTILTSIRIGGAE